MSDSPVMEVEITTVAERPELHSRFYEIGAVWPEFMGKDPVTNAFMYRVPEVFPEYCVVATDAGGSVVAQGRSLPFGLASAGRSGLPNRGLDGALVWGFTDLDRGVPTDTVSALEITVAAGHTGKGLSGRLLAAMRESAKRQGHNLLVAPVRPNWKHREPTVPMPEYAARVRPDGLPYDPWLRTHVRVGGTIESVASASMTMSGSLAEWRAWTGLPFDTDGPVVVPDALVPVHCDVNNDYAVYVEPNVWVRHDLRG